MALMLSNIDEIAWTYLTVKVSEYYDSGELLKTFTLVNFVKNGIEERYERSGTLTYISTYLNGKLHGDYFCNGIIKSKRQYAHDKLNGLVIDYTDNNEDVSLAHYKDDRLHGKSTSYDRYANLKFITFYVNGLKHGQCKIYKNGLLISSITYVNGIKHGSYIDNETGENNKYIYGLKK